LQNNEVFLPKGKQAHLCMVQRQKTRRITNYDRLRELAVNEGFGVFDIVFEELTPHQIVEFMRYCDGLVSVPGRSSVLLKPTYASAIASVLVLVIGLRLLLLGSLALRLGVLSVCCCDTLVRVSPILHCCTRAPAFPSAGLDLETRSLVALPRINLPAHKSCFTRSSFLMSPLVLQAAGVCSDVLMRSVLVRISPFGECFEFRRLGFEPACFSCS
jgi:hypothetical protein